MITLIINGESHTLDVEPDMPLLWVIRDRLNLTGTKYGCGVAQCGACTVHIDGQAARSCSILASDAAGKAITTIEGLSGDVAAAVQRSWRELDVVQCGYCQSGQIMTAVNLLTGNKTPSDDDIDGAFAGNVCRCGTYQRIRAAVHDAAKSLA